MLNHNPDKHTATNPAYIQPCLTYSPTQKCEEQSFLACDIRNRGLGLNRVPVKPSFSPSSGRAGGAAGQPRVPPALQGAAPAPAGAAPAEQRPSKVALPPGAAAPAAGSGSASPPALNPSLAAASPHRRQTPSAPEHPPAARRPLPPRQLPPRAGSAGLALLPQPGPRGGRRCPRGRRPYLSR